MKEDSLSFSSLRFDSGHLINCFLVVSLLFLFKRAVILSFFFFHLSSALILSWLMYEENSDVSWRWWVGEWGRGWELTRRLTFDSTLLTLLSAHSRPAPQVNCEIRCGRGRDTLTSHYLLSLCPYHFILNSLAGLLLSKLLHVLPPLQAEWDPEATKSDRAVMRSSCMCNFCRIHIKHRKVYNFPFNHFTMI